MLSGRRARKCSRTSSVNRRCGLPQRRNPAKTSFMTSLPFPGGFLFLDRDVSIGLVGNHLPAAGQAGQNRGFGSALREQHETMAFISLSSAPIRMVHVYAFARASIEEMSIFSGQVLSARKRAYDETCILPARAGRGLPVRNRRVGQSSEKARDEQWRRWPVTAGTIYRFVGVIFATNPPNGL